jgi:putative endonuclease
MYFVYILYSEKLNRYYVGSTNNITDRIKRHNAGQGGYTKKGIPWKLIQTFEFQTRSEAVRFEMKVKKKRNRKIYPRFRHRGVAQSG